MRNIDTARQHLKAAAAASALILALGAGSGHAQEAGFGTDEEKAFGKAIWASMLESGLAGEDAINAYPYSGTQPHGAILTTLKTTLSVEGETGVFIVKRNYGPADQVSLDDVWADPSNGLAAVTVMFRRDGFDPKNGDWFWVKYLPDGSFDTAPNGAAMTSRVGGCIACHASAGGDDMVFSNDPRE